MFGRFMMNMARIGRFADDIRPSLTKALVKGGTSGGKIIGKGASAGIKAGQKAVAGTTGAVGKFLEKGGPIKLASNAGTLGANMIHEAETTVHGVNNILGKARTGWGSKGIGKLIKDSDSNIFGFKATKLGVTALAAGGAIMGAKDAVQQRLERQRGMTVGSGGNAPINNYAYQGHSYADNAGATGDLVLSMHNQRKTGIL